MSSIGPTEEARPGGEGAAPGKGDPNPKTPGLTRFSLGRPITILMLVISLMVLGGISLTRLPLDFLPYVDFPFIGVWMPYPNAIPAQVETEIARPIEEILATIGNVKTIFSESDADECFVGVEFDWGREVDILRLEVKEKIDQIRNELPSDLRDLYLFTFNSNDIPIMMGRISAHGRDLSRSYEIIERRILNPIERLDGVGRVEIDGVAPEEVAIYLHLDRLKQHRVDVRRLG
jgi:HAE1 family hydrophobic/amphiphilic exporter-1